jgi:hypothetical protein
VPAKNKKRGKRYYLNLNNYRGAHYHVLNAWKKEFSRIVGETLVPRIEELANLVEQGPLILTYTVYPFQKSDPANVACIVDKFFCDVLQEFEVIPDDDHTHIAEVRYRFGFVNRIDPHCDVKIENH